MSEDQGELERRLGIGQRGYPCGGRAERCPRCGARMVEDGLDEEHVCLSCGERLRCLPPSASAG